MTARRPILLFADGRGAMAAAASSTASDTPTTLHLVSWNVAGFDATLKYVKQHYKSWDAYLERHRADILALQEVKLTRAKVQAEPAAACAHPFGFAAPRCTPRPWQRPLGCSSLV